MCNGREEGIVRESGRLIKNGIVYINRKLEFYITADSESPRVRIQGTGQRQIR